MLIYKVTLAELCWNLWMDPSRVWN